MANLPCTLPLISILIIIINSAMPAEVVAVAPVPSPASSSSDMAVVQAQAQALIAIKDAITNDPYSRLSSWTTTTTSSSSSNSTSDVVVPPSYCIAGWFGLHCNDRFHITSLNLSSCNLSGSISPSLALLPSLSLLDLSYNNFSGPILFFTQPPNSSSLTYLDLSFNALSGDIPLSLILNSPNLQTLQLKHTGLHGIVPPAIWTHLHALQHLYISDSWSYSSPSLLSISPTSFPATGNFSFCATIEVFVLDGLDASGASFPSSLGDCQQLQTLILSTSGLQGSIPPSIWQLPHLQRLVIEDLNVADAAYIYPYEQRPYKLHGSLPSTFGFCSTAGSTIQEMSIEGINLTGHIPVSIGTCASLQTLNFLITNLEGPIPSILGNLTQLQTLILSTTGLQGSIPQSIWQLPHLQMLVIEDLNVADAVSNYPYEPRPYKLHGSLPSTFGFCSTAGSTIQDMSIDGINLTGHIPASIGTCSSLQTLNLLGTNLEGSIPSSFGNLTQLQTFILTTMGLQGSIPPSIWQLPHLQVLVIVDLNVFGTVEIHPYEPRPYNLHGSLPSTFGFCSADGSTIKIMSIDGINLTGHIPASIGTCASLQYLHLTRTSLEGPIPSSLGNLTQLQTLCLDSNNLTGSIPPSIGRLINTYNLTLNNNHLSGHIPLELGALTNLQILDLSTNSLQGIIPVDALHNLTALETLRFSQNNLTGKIQSLDLSKMPNLQIFGAHGNALEGSLPAGLTENKALVIFDVQGNKYLTGSLGNTTTPNITGLSKLRVLSVSYNQLSGDIPGWVWKLPSLQALDLSNNHFSGRLPATLTYLFYFKLNQTADSNQKTLYEEVPVTLKNAVCILEYVLSARIYFDVSMNDLEGEIPDSFRELRGLTGVNLSHNRITGPIGEATFGRLMQLEVLDLSYNQLSGGIPQDLTSLGSLSTLNLVSNQLEGPIPTQNNFNTRFTSASFENNPGLCGYPLSSCNTSINDASSDVGTTASQTQHSIMIWFNEFISPRAFLIAYPVGLALGFFFCHTLSFCSLLTAYGLLALCFSRLETH